MACGVIGVVLALIQEFFALYASLKRRNEAKMHESGLKGYEMGAKYSKLKDVTVTEQAIDADSHRTAYAREVTGTKQKRKHGWKFRIRSHDVLNALSMT